VPVKDNLGPRYRPEDVYWGNLLEALEALNCGATTLVDWSHISLTPDHSDAAVQALLESEIRAVYAHRPPPSNEWWANSERRHPEDARRMRSQYFATDDQLVTFALALRAPGNVTPETAVQDWLLAKELAARVTVHVGGRATGIQCRQVTDLEELGLLGPDILFVHCMTAVTRNST
jgi:cytosine/adenosine deaminase-related metal-dependent hydrolase